MPEIQSLLPSFAKSVQVSAMRGTNKLSEMFFKVDVVVE